MRSGIVFLAVVLPLATAGAFADKAAETNPESLTVFTTQARVEINANGQIAAVEPDPRLPPLLGDAIRNTIGAWKFVPASKDGKPVAGVTYVKLGGCAVHEADGDHVAFVHLGHGPGGLSEPRYPPAVMRYRGEADLQVKYRVEQDGSAVVEDIQYLKGDKVFAKDFRRSIRDWLSDGVFQPEILAGQPVATRITQDVRYRVPQAVIEETMSQEAKQREFARAEQERAQEKSARAEHPSCQAALQEASKRQQAVVIESLFQLLPSG